VPAGELDGESCELEDLDVAQAAAGFAGHGESFLDGEPRVLAVAGRDGDDDAVEEARGPAQDVQMPERDRIEGAGIDGGAEGSGHRFPVAAHSRSGTSFPQARMHILRHLPNILTAARLPAIFLITVWTYWAGPWASAALALFILAALTDIFDGWIARKLDAVTDFGRLMDALVDKIFILGLLIGLAAVDCLPVTRWSDAGEPLSPDASTVLYTSFGVMLIVIREFLITGLRLVAAASGQVLEAEGLGKIKTFLQILAIGHLIGLRAYESHWKLSAEWHQRWEVIIMALFWLSVVLTVFSGLSYLIRHRRHLPGLAS
jgi:phosphatidylglycerophosphate synthase